MRLRYTIDPPFADLRLRSTVVGEVSGVRVREQDPELEAVKAAAAAESVALPDDAVTRSDELDGYRELVQNRGRSVKKFPPAAESLLLQVRRTGRLPTINTAVDSYNVVVLRRLLALGVHDIGRIGPEIRFRLSPGGEEFRSVGSDSVKTTQPGDFVYADEHRVLAWLDSKDSNDVKISLETRDLVIVVQGTARTTLDYTAAALKEACELITRYCGGSYEMAHVEPDGRLSTL